MDTWLCCKRQGGISAQFYAWDKCTPIKKSRLVKQIHWGHTDNEFQNSSTVSAYTTSKPSSGICYYWHPRNILEKSRHQSQGLHNFLSGHQATIQKHCPKDSLNTIRHCPPRNLFRYPSTMNNDVSFQSCGPPNLIKVPIRSDLLHDLGRPLCMFPSILLRAMKDLYAMLPLTAPVPYQSWTKASLSTASPTMAIRLLPSGALTISEKDPGACKASQSREGFLNPYWRMLWTASSIWSFSGYVAILELASAMKRIESFDCG